MSRVFPQAPMLLPAMPLPEGWERPSLHRFSREFLRNLFGLGSMRWGDFLPALPPSPFRTRIFWNPPGVDGDHSTRIEISDHSLARVLVNPAEVSACAEHFIPFFGPQSTQAVAFFTICHEIGHAWDDIVVSRDGDARVPRGRQYHEAFADCFAALCMRSVGMPSAVCEHFALWRENVTPGHGSPLAIRKTCEINPGLIDGKEDWYLRLALCERMGILHESMAPPGVGAREHSAPPAP